MALSIKVDHVRPHVALLTIEGRLNAVTAGDLKEKMKTLVARKTVHLILDLHGVDFIDSSGLAALVSGLKSTREVGGSLKLVGLNENTMKVFKLTRLNRVFTFYDQLDQAISDLSID